MWTRIVRSPVHKKDNFIFAVPSVLTAKQICIVINLNILVIIVYNSINRTINGVLTL